MNKFGDDAEEIPEVDEGEDFTEADVPEDGFDALEDPGETEDTLVEEPEDIAPDLIVCQTAPESIVLSCESPSLVSESSNCTLTIDTLEGQVPCLDCRLKIGPTIVDISDFGDARGACEPDGWALASGVTCYNSYNTMRCSEQGEPIECCSEFDTICTERFGNFLLKSDWATNCTGGYAEWRMTKSFDTTGLANIELCFNVGGIDIDRDEYLWIRVSDDASHSEYLMCYHGNDMLDSIAFSSGILYRHCLNLPDWAEDNDNITVTITATSNTNDDTVFVDDVSLKGSPALCPPSIHTAFNEDFSDCPDPITDGWNEWTVVGEPRCPGFDCPGGNGDSFGAEAESSEWSLEHTVDTTELDGNVLLCFDLGETGADAGESINVEFSTDGGDVWQTAWHQDGNMTPDWQCRNICVDLSGIDVNVRRNPSVRIRFTLRSTGTRIDIDDITVTGVDYCDAGTDVQLGPITETPTPGIYEFQVQDVSMQPLTVLVDCTWSNGEISVTGLDEIVFESAP